MGYSATRKAFKTLELIDESFNDQEISNGIGSFGFYEIGEEQKDGAIIGEVFKYVDNSGGVRKLGNFKVESNGVISEFSGLSASIIGSINIEIK